MMFQGRYDRARELQKEQNKGKKRAFDETELENVLEKHDTLAMILSALLVFLPTAILALGGICLIGWLFFFR